MTWNFTSMIPKMLPPDLVRGANWFSEKIMLKQQASARSIGSSSELECDPGSTLGAFLPSTRFSPFLKTFRR